MKSSKYFHRYAVLAFWLTLCLAVTAHGEFVDNGDGTVTDTQTGLMWQQATDAGTMIWKSALSYCEGLGLSGYSDWRLPTRKELRSIVDYSRYNPSIDTSYFPNTHSSDYWSSTTHALGTDYAWSMYFDYGYDNYSLKSYGGYVRAVRGGQPRLLGHLIISAPVQGAAYSAGTSIPITWDTAGIGGDVSIAISRDGGKTYTDIVASTPNDGSYNWTVTGPTSVNCMLKIMPLSDPTKLTVQGFFAIYDLANGLIAYYPFNGNADDASGNGNHGTVEGAVLSTDRNGDNDKAYAFDGVDDYIRCDTVGTPVNAFTYSLWFNPSVSLDSNSPRQDFIYGISYGRPHISFNADYDPADDGKIGLYYTIAPAVLLKLQRRHGLPKVGIRSLSLGMEIQSKST